MALRRKISP